MQAVTIGWIAAKFTEEHRSTLDWLNKITDESFRFLGLEVELWRIGNSPAAPRFNIVARPNNWSQSVAHAARALNEVALSGTRITQRDYWAALNEILNTQSGPVIGNRKPRPQSWMSFSIGRTGFSLGASMIRSKKRIRAEIYIAGDSAKIFLAPLKQKSTMIEAELGYPLEWEELPLRRDCRIAVYKNYTNPDNTKDWIQQHTWLATKLNELHRSFSRKIAALDVDTKSIDIQATDNLDQEGV